MNTDAQRIDFLTKRQQNFVDRLKICEGNIQRLASLVDDEVFKQAQPLAWEDMQKELQDMNQRRSLYKNKIKEYDWLLKEIKSR